MDRLNALLEPNGELIIGERGVNADGQIVTVKPHKDFRLFLTMDPKYGEISRAMRNRGIEIHMFHDNNNDFDLKAMIGAKGLKNNAIVNNLIEIHEYIGGYILGEPFGLSHLLQSSFLLAQQLERGMNVKLAFLNTILDVYYKTKSENDFSLNDFDALLKTKINELLNRKKEDLYNEKTTININYLQSQSEIEKIKQQTSLLQTKSFDLSLLYMLAQIYSITSAEDFDTRNLLLRNLLGEKDFEIAAMICKSIGDLLPEEPADLPQDLRWIPYSVYKNRNLSEPNKIMLNMMISVQSINLKLNVEKGFLIEYMRNVKLRKMEGKIDDVVVVMGLVLFEKYNDFLQNITTTKSVIMNDEQFIQTLSLIRWRNSFQKSFLVKIPKQNTIQFQEMLSNLHIHYKWFSKYAIHNLLHLLNIEISESLQEVVEKTDQIITQELSPLKKIAKLYQKLNNLPPPLINTNQLVLIPAFNELTKKLDLYNKCNDFEIVLNNLQKHRNVLIEISMQLNYDLCDYPENFRNILVDSKPEALMKSYEIQLLPLLDHFVRKEVLIMRNFGIKNNILMNSLTVPCSLAGVWLRYNQNFDARLEHEINTEIYYYLMNCATQHPTKFLNCKSEEEEIVFLDFSPTLSYILMQMLIPDDNLNRFTCLGNYVDVRKQLRIVEEVLWRNMKQFSSFEGDYL